MGFIIAFTRTAFIDIDMLNQQIKYIKIAGTIKYSEKSLNGTKIILEKVQALTPKYKPIFDKNNFGDFSLTWRGKKAIASTLDFTPGSRISALTILDPIKPKMFRNAYDFRMQSFFNNISGRGYILKEPRLLSSNANQISKFKDKIRFSINKKINSVLPDIEGGIVQALIAGNKSVIKKQVRQEFADSGLAHILAISGLHISIIGGFFFILFRFLLCLVPRLALQYNCKKIAAILSLVFVFLYLQISGESIPAIRAFIMHLIIVIAILVNKTAFSMRSVAVAAIVVMTLYPESILFPSFQMSFSAVTALIAFYEKSWKYSKYIVFVVALFTTSLVASLATALFTINTFNRISFAAIFANLIAVPLTSCFIMPMSVISVLSMPISIEHIPLNALKYGIHFLCEIAKWFSQQDNLIYQLPTPDIICFSVILSGMLFWAILSSKIRHYGAGIIAIGIFIYFTQNEPIAISIDSGRLVGIKNQNCVYFNDIRHNRSITNDITKSFGLSQKKRIPKSDMCGNTYIYYTDNKPIEITVGKHKFEEVYYKNNSLIYQEFHLQKRKWS